MQDLATQLALKAKDLRKLTIPPAMQSLLLSSGADDIQDAFAQLLTYLLFSLKAVHPHVNCLDSYLEHMQKGSFFTEFSHEMSNMECGHPILVIAREIVDILSKNPIEDMADPLIYFYEMFLDKYDRKQKNELGVYYTPVEIVTYMVNEADQWVMNTYKVSEGLACNLTWGEYLGTPMALEAGFQEIPKGCESEDFVITILDPATGTGTYILRVLAVILSRSRDLDKILPRVRGFELMWVPIMICKLRFEIMVYCRQRTEMVQIYQTNTLSCPIEGQDILNRLKFEKGATVVLGNPPYKRGQKDLEGWVMDPRSGGGRAIWMDYIHPIQAAGEGVHIKNLYNLYVYFWRWVTWKALEQDKAPGFVSMITPSSYLNGPAFGGLRQNFRSISNHMSLIDLGGDGRRGEGSNVFGILSPVCILSLGTGETHPARFWEGVGLPTGLEGSWIPLEGHGMASFKNAPASIYQDWPCISQIIPWQTSGRKAGRTWPIGETREVLESRFLALVNSEDKEAAFKVSTDRGVPDLTTQPKIAICGFRSFHMQYIIEDTRYLDRISPTLTDSHSEHQVYFTRTLYFVEKGPALVASPHPVEDHFYSGSGGGGAYPMCLDKEGTRFNLTEGFLDAYGARLGIPIKPIEVFAYAYGITAHESYTASYRDVMRLLGVHIPFTLEPDLFKSVVAQGMELLRWHTYGLRCRTANDGFKLGGRIQVITPISDRIEDFPVKAVYDPDKQIITWGTGTIGPVTQSLWDFTVGNYPAVRNWFSYRSLKGAGKTSSPLDHIRAISWTDAMTQTMLEMLWALDYSVHTSYPIQAELLVKVLDRPILDKTQIPIPEEWQKCAPKPLGYEPPSLFGD